MKTQPWKRVEPTLSTTISYRTIVAKHFVHPDGRMLEFGTLYPEGHESAATIALTPNGKVLIFRQFRPGPEMIMDELPGGVIEPGSTP